MSLDSQCMLPLFFFKHLCRYGSATFLHTILVRSFLIIQQCNLHNIIALKSCFSMNARLLFHTNLVYWQVLVVFYFVELLQRGYLAKRQLLEETVSL